MGNNICKECNICVEKKSPTLFLAVTTKCKHDKTICRNCVERYIDANLNGKGDVFIQCPFEGCKKVIEHNDVKRIANQELFERSCGEKSCYTHDVPWHENMSCAQYEEKSKESEAATNHYLMKHTKPCPKCGTHIEKNGGCNHMTCKIRSCSYEFCWL
ncbi:4875_t:CDS:2 [Gigaspora margarita]|uniref:RBR-type E3 ubiquitin transferase n=1 Tax=Gigaspora margarita TaxID=4874 RepID=A0ABN7UGQ5_GIGMA|nr:4875_t:CDS:2 [Gigaspora margarita]